MNEPNTYAETHFLLAVLEEDEETAQSILEGMRPKELRDLGSALLLAQQMVNQEMARQLHTLRVQRERGVV